MVDDVSITGRRARDLHRLGHAGELHRSVRSTRCPTRTWMCLTVEQAEACKVDFDLVVAWRKKGREEAARPNRS